MLWYKPKFDVIKCVNLCTKHKIASHVFVHKTKIQSESVTLNYKINISLDI